MYSNMMWVDPDKLDEDGQGRETTRPEDIVYCLFGLFDVNLPLLYGEGSEEDDAASNPDLSEQQSQNLTRRRPTAT